MSRTKFYAYSDANGNYNIQLDTGLYTVSAIAPNEYWLPCDEEATLLLENNYDTIAYNYGFTALEDCPALEVDLSTPFLSYCTENEYHVHYKNNGTIALNTAIIKISLPEEFTLVGGSINPYDIDDKTFSFYVNDLEVNTKNSFSIIVQHDCENDIPLLTHALEARISSEETCSNIDPRWDGSSVQVLTQIVEDSVYFFIENRGEEDMRSGKTSIIIEDILVVRTEPYELQAGERLTIVTQPNGKTVQVQAQQSDFHPGFSRPNAIVEGVGMDEMGNVSLGIVTMYPEDDKDIFKSIDAQQSYESYLPHLLRAYPKGIGAEKIIAPNTDIEYLIRFQNTGRDTLHSLSIQNELAEIFDIRTLRPGASSHPYNFEILEEGILRFSFKNLRLPNALENEEGSHGFVKFRVSQLPDIAHNTRFFNQAFIYQADTVIATNANWHLVQNADVYQTEFEEICREETWNGINLENDTVIIETYTLENYDSITTWSFEVFKGDTIQVDTIILMDSLYENIPMQRDTIFTYRYENERGCDSLIIVNVEIDSSLGIWTPPSVENLNLYPNPLTDVFTIDFTTDERQSLEILMYRYDGKLLSKIYENSNVEIGKHQVQINQYYPPGLYWLRLKWKEGAESTLKILIRQ